MAQAVAAAKVDGGAARVMTFAPNGTPLTDARERQLAGQGGSLASWCAGGTRRSTFSGKMSYHANIAMVKFLVTEIMPRVWAKRPATKLVVVGKDPDINIREFGRNPLITITGTVDDIRPFLWQATVSVVPLLYGAGIQNKILEAMATGTPVVTTARTISALEVVPGQELLVADTAEAFSSAVLRLIEDEGLRHEIGQAGLEYVRKKHSWKNIASLLADVYRLAVRS